MEKKEKLPIFKTAIAPEQFKVGPTHEETKQLFKQAKKEIKQKENDLVNLLDDDLPQ